MRYFAMVGSGFLVVRPLALLRSPVDGVLESYRRDGRWRPDRRVDLLTGEADRDLVEVTAAQAEQLGLFWSVWKSTEG
jgi:hypothetical protein